MVAGGFTNRLSPRVVDAIGLSFVSACCVGFVWLTCFHTDHTSQQVADLRQALARERVELQTLRARTVRQKTVLAEREAELRITGKLPNHAPIEAYFRMLSGLATKQGLRIIGHHPLQPRTYPGLMERRFAYEVAGTMPNLTRFFLAIEESDYWADIGYLKLDHHRTGRAGAESDRIARLTISLFSGMPTDTRTGDG